MGGGGGGGAGCCCNEALCSMCVCAVFAESDTAPAGMPSDLPKCMSGDGSLLQLVYNPRP